MAKTRVLIADDHGVLRGALALLINAQADLEVVAEASDAGEALRLARTRELDVVLMDLSMPGPPALDAIKQIVRCVSRPRVLVLTMHDDAAWITSTRAAGASGYVMKKSAHSELIDAIRVVSRGQTAFRSIDVLSAQHQPRTLLSAREGQVLRQLAHGNTNLQIGQRLGISVKTIETHRARIAEKLGTRRRADMYRFYRLALQTGSLGPDDNDD
jgi:two-component system, NarL family, response regulator NreC